MGNVCSALNWTPEQFWKSTPHELAAISEAQQETAATMQSGGVKPLTRSEYEDLKNLSPDPSPSIRKR